MKKIIVINVILFFFLFVSCEQTKLVEVNLESLQKIVVESEIESGLPFNGVRITRTIPIDEEYDHKKAEIKDAYVFLLINKVRMVPLHYTIDGLYLPLYELRVMPGDTYELFATVKDSYIYSITRVPFHPEVLSVSYNNAGYFESSIRSVDGEAYGSLWVVLSNPAVKDNGFFSIEPTKDLNPVATRTNLIDQKYMSSTFDGKRQIHVFSFDKQFVDYFKSKPQVVPGESGVTTGGSGVAWNVKGKNVIGLFIGLSRTTVSSIQ